jgi:hypothetical protein
MGWRLLAGAVALAHFGFIAYVVFGGVLAWWRPRALLAHAFAVGWAFAGILVVLPCPLTDLEDLLRARASTRWTGTGSSTTT